MCKLFDEWSPQIREYCNNNNLSFEKAQKMSQCWGKNDIILQYYDDKKARKQGLLDETPMPIVLKIFRNKDHVEFEQTEYTQRYLAAN